MLNKKNVEKTWQNNSNLLYSPSWSLRCKFQMPAKKQAVFWPFSSKACCGISNIFFPNTAQKEIPSSFCRSSLTIYFPLSVFQGVFWKAGKGEERFWQNFAKISFLSWTFLKASKKFFCEVFLSENCFSPRLRDCRFQAWFFPRSFIMPGFFRPTVIGISWSFRGKQ